MENKIVNRKWWVVLLTILWQFAVFILIYSVFSIPAVYFENPWICGVISFSLGAASLFIYHIIIKMSEHGATPTLRAGRLLPDMGKGFCTGAGFFLVVTGILALLGCYHVKAITPSAALFDQLGLFFLVGACEEILFRGVIFRMIEGKWGLGTALIVSALLFGIMHIFNPGSSLWSCIAIAIEAGLLLGMAYKVSGTLWFPVGIHWAWNYFEGPVLGFLVSGSESGMPLLKSVVTGNNMISGGKFGPEASVITVLLGLVTSCYFYWKYRKSLKINMDSVR